MKLVASTSRLTLLIAALLLLSFAFQIPGKQAADWQLFSFYDPGTTLKGDALLTKGYVPTVDFGYTHGLIPLAFGRAGFAILGRTPWAYLFLTLGTQLVMAWGLARILKALVVSGPALVVFLLALPIAIMPAYLTLTHPLEAMLLILALASHAEGRRSSALALLAVCIFVKPSMAYVYGFALCIWILANTRDRLRTRLKNFLPAIITAAITFLVLAAIFGLGPVLHTVVPITGARTYAATNFGFFSASGQHFWLRTDQLSAYFITPLGIWLVAVIASLVVAALVLLQSLVFRVAAFRSPRVELLLTLVFLHTLFVVGFYGWTGSWTYYSYMPMLLLAILLTILPAPAWLAASVLVVLAHAQTVGWTLNDWRSKKGVEHRLYAWPTQYQEFHEILTRVGNNPTLLMTHGYLDAPTLPANVTLPDAWFPEPGIPTPSEIRRVQNQIESAHFIIQWNEYGPLDLLNSPDFAPLRPHFRTAHTGRYLTLLERIPPAAATTQLVIEN